MKTLLKKQQHCELVMKALIVEKARRIFFLKKSI